MNLIFFKDTVKCMNAYKPIHQARPLFFALILLLCMHAWRMWMLCRCVWRREDNSMESIPSFQFTGHRATTLPPTFKASKLLLHTPTRRVRSTMISKTNEQTNRNLLGKLRYALFKCINCHAKAMNPEEMSNVQWIKTYDNDWLLEWMKHWFG